jgi:cytochrome b561
MDNALLYFQTRWHSQLGIAVMVGALLQLIMGLMRPDAPKNLKEKKTGKRNAFEWIHGTFGKLLIIASIIAIFSGLVQMGVPLFGIIIFAVYIGLAVATAIVLEIIKCRRESQK